MDDEMGYKSPLDIRCALCLPAQIIPSPARHGQSHLPLCLLPAHSPTSHTNPLTLDIVHRMDSSKFEAFLGWQFRSMRSMLGASN